MDIIYNMKRLKMDRITSIINRFLMLYFIIYFLILTHPVQTRRSSSSSNSASSSSSNNLAQISGSCELALRKCSKQIACGMTLHDYRLSCKQVLYGAGKNCTEICQLAIASLLSTPEGQQYLNCDCGSNDYCKQIRARTAACNAKNGDSIISQLPANHPLVQQAALFTNGSSAAILTTNNNNSNHNNHHPYSKSSLSNSNSNNLNSNHLPGLSTSSSSSHPSSSHPPSSSSSGLNQGFVQQYGLAAGALYPKLSKSRHSNKSHSCRSVKLTCRSDVHCSTVYDSYRTHCADALQGERCSSRYNNSLTLLWKQRNGHNFKNCHCDKSSSRCRRQRANLMRSCYSIGISTASAMHPFFYFYNGYTLIVIPILGTIRNLFFDN